MRKVLTVVIYFISIVLSCILCIEIGSELITQFTMYQNGYDEIERHHLADDLGFGMLLMLGLIPEVLCGTVIGIWFSRIVNNTYNKPLKQET